MAWNFSAADFDRELAREFIDWVLAELADPPPGWEALIEEHQLIVIYQHVDSYWRKYPEPGELIPVGTYWLCLRCSYPKRWGARRCWWCDQRRGVLDWPDEAYGVGFQPEVEGAPGRRRPVDLGQPADPPRAPTTYRDDFAPVMRLCS